jgi:hypothetical protein
MDLAPELAAFVDTLSSGGPADLDSLGVAGRALGIDWPPDYLAVMSRHDGGSGEIDGWPAYLYPASMLVRANAEPRAGGGSGVVWFGWDGLGEDYGFERATGRVVLRADGGEVEIYRESLVDWLRRPPDLRYLRGEAVEGLARAATRRGAR